MVNRLDSLCYTLCYKLRNNQNVQQTSHIVTVTGPWWLKMRVRRLTKKDIENSTNLLHIDIND